MTNRFLVGLSLLLALTAVCFGQSPESLLIGPGDMLHIVVFDTPELEQHVRVVDAGSIPLLVGGDVKVSGLTPTDAGRAIEKALKDGQFLLHPRVSVVVEEYATQKVSVLGEVKAPGAYAISTPRSILDVLGMAGGINEVADRKLTIRRKNGESVGYVFSNDAKQAVVASVDVMPGDTVIVPRAGVVYILGDVKTPGGYTMTNNAGQLTALELVARAGGANHSAVPSRARLIHRTASGYVDEPLALSDMQKGRKPDVTLNPDDIIYVPFSYARNFALNASGVAASLGSAAIYRF